MIEMQTVLDTLMAALKTGGVNAAKEIFKGVVVKGAEKAAKTWKKIFEERPESYPLADQVAKNPEDRAAKDKLCALLEDELKKRPELWRQMQVNMGNISAGGSVTTINNRLDELIGEAGEEARARKRKTMASHFEKLRDVTVKAASGRHNSETT